MRWQCRKCRSEERPVFPEMLALAQELADLEEQILNTVSEEIPVGEPELPPVELSEADKKLIQQYKDLFSGSGSLEGMQVARPEPKVEEPVQTRPKIQLNVKKVDLDEAKQSYKEKLEEMKLLMEKLRPEGDMTPQMQRNYYSARKLPVLRKSVTKAPVCWICNLCGCHHSHPSECAQPELGGTWVYEDVVTVTKTFEYQDD